MQRNVKRNTRGYCIQFSLVCISYLLHLFVRISEINFTVSFPAYIELGTTLLLRNPHCTSPSYMQQIILFVESPMMKFDPHIITF